MENRRLRLTDKDRTRTPLIGATVVLMLLGPLVSPAAAYLDPGAGSLVVQAVLAGMAGAAVVAQLCWQRLARFLGRLRTEDTPRVDDHADTSH